MTAITTEKGVKNAAAPTVNAPVPDAPAPAFDRAEFSRLFSRVRAEVSTIVQDANKKRPLFSKSHETAVAKRDAVMKALESFIDMVDSAKREG